MLPMLRSGCPITWAVAMLLLGLSAQRASAETQITLVGVTSLEAVYGAPGVGVGPDGAAFDPVNGQLWLVDSTTATVHALKQDALDAPPVVSFSVAAGLPQPFPEGIAWVPGGFLYVVNQGTPSNSTPAQIARFDTSGAQLGAVTIAFGNSGIAFDAQRNLLQITNDIANEVQTHAFDPNFASAPLVSRLALAPLGIADPEAVEVDPATGHLFIVDDEHDVLVEVTETGTVVQTVELAALTGFSDPEGLAFDPTRRILYVAFDDDAALAALHVTAPPAPPVPHAVPLPAWALLLGGGVIAMLGCRALASRRSARPVPIA